MTIVNASARANYDLLSQQPLQIESDGALAVDGAYQLRLYPAVSAQIYADRGTAVLDGAGRQRVVIKEGVNFSGSNTARPVWPVTTLTAVELIGELTTLTDDGFEAADLSGADFYIAANGELVAPMVLYGPVSISYISDYRIIRYTPLLSISIDAKEFVFSTGTVFAHFEGQTAQYDIELTPLSRVGEAEFFVAVSDIIGDSLISGWEKPPDWPNSPDYPQVFPEGVPDINNSATRERVHAAGSYNVIGAVGIQWRTVKNLRPYKASRSYEPQVRVIFADGPEPGLERGYESAVRQKPRIIERLAARYPNFIGEAS